MGSSGQLVHLDEDKPEQLIDIRQLHTLKTLHPDEQNKLFGNIIESYLSLFSGTPSCGHLVDHDVDDAQPIKQHFYRSSPDKQQILESEANGRKWCCLLPLLVHLCVC